MLYLTREEFRTAATTLGFKPATLANGGVGAPFRPLRNPAWFFFNDNFEILEAPPPIPANSTLASLAARTFWPRK